MPQHAQVLQLYMLLTRKWVPQDVKESTMFLINIYIFYIHVYNTNALFRIKVPRGAKGDCYMFIKRKRVAGWQREPQYNRNIQ